MKILVLNGSPKDESSTMLLTNAFLEGVNLATGDNEIKVVSSIKKNIKYCTGCLACWFTADNHCIIQDDDMNNLLDDMMESDMIVWSFPLHCHSIPASLKAVLDRTIAFLKINMVETPLYIDHEKTFDLSEKKNIFIIGGGYPSYPDNFASVKMLLQTYFNNPVTMCFNETALLATPVPELKPLKDNLFSQIKLAGQEYATSDAISAKIIENVEKSMIPNEMYINIVNSLAGKQ